MDRNFGAIVAIIVVVFATLGMVVAQHADRASFVARVEKSERVTIGSGDSQKQKYLVFTNRGVFENTDSIIEGKWDSSDVYGRLKTGECYSFDTYGWRVQLLSWYPNIVNATHVECETHEGK